MQEMERRRAAFDIKRFGKLQKLVFIFNHSFEFIPDRKARVIKKASYLIAAITFLQPFNDGNKTTGLLLGIDYLQQNGLDLPRETKKQKDEIYSLLVQIMLSTKSYDDMEKFLESNVVNRL